MLNKKKQSPPLIGWVEVKHEQNKATVPTKPPPQHDGSNQVTDEWTALDNDNKTINT